MFSGKEAKAERATNTLRVTVAFRNASLTTLAWLTIDPS
jgi:hypothetical protein